MNAHPEVDPPDDDFLRRRWVRHADKEWAKSCNRILVEHGAIVGRTIYEKRDHARWRARRLINLLVELDLHHRWELREHVDRKQGGYFWTVEYLGGRRNDRAAGNTNT